VFQSSSSPANQVRKSSICKTEPGGILIWFCQLREPPLGVCVKTPEFGDEVPRTDVLSKFEKFSLTLRADKSRPRILSCWNKTSGESRDIESSCNNVSIFARVLCTLARIALRPFNVRVEASNIKDIGSSGSKLSSEIAENMEMSTSSSMVLSGHDTLRSK